MPLCISFLLKGECWSGPDAAKTYDRAGPSNSCITKGVLQKCNVSDDVVCVGGINTNFNYGISYTGDCLSYVFATQEDRQFPHSILPLLIFTLLLMLALVLASLRTRLKAVKDPK